MQYIYCSSHGSVHVAKDGEDVWCTAAQASGMILLYPSHMQEYAGWDNKTTLHMAREWANAAGLWLYDEKEN